MGRGLNTFSPISPMANNSITQRLLAADQNFQLRIRAAFLSSAAQVMFEDPGTANHTARAAFAAKILTSSDYLGNAVTQFTPLIVLRPNVIGFATSYDFTIPAFVNASGDADLVSQLSTDWNILTATFVS